MPHRHHMHGSLLSQGSEWDAQPAGTWLRPAIDSTAPRLIAQRQQEKKGLMSNGNNDIKVSVFSVSTLRVSVSQTLKTPLYLRLTTQFMALLNSPLVTITCWPCVSERLLCRKTHHHQHWQPTEVFCLLLQQPPNNELGQLGGTNLDNMGLNFTYVEGTRTFSGKLLCLTFTHVWFRILQDLVIAFKRNWQNRSSQEGRQRGDTVYQQCTIWIVL